LLAGFPLELPTKQTDRSSCEGINLSAGWVRPCRLPEFHTRLLALAKQMKVPRQKERYAMKQAIPVAGVDVSKRFSDMCVLAPNNEIFARMKIYHDLPSMERAAAELRHVSVEYGVAPVIVMESTSHYHLILFQFFREAGYEVIVVNPIQSGALKNINVRKVKNDKVDAYKIAMLYRLKVLRTSQVPVDSLRGLRLLCRQRSELMGDVTRYKNRLTAYLDQVFPGYDKVFSDVGGASSRAVLKECPTPQILLLKSESELVGLIRVAGNKGLAFGQKKAAQLREAAEGAIKLGLYAPGNSAVIGAVLEVLETLLRSVWQIEQDIKALTIQEAYIRENLALLQSIPGIGPHSSIVILSEIGDFALFQKPKQLAAYFGLDPSERQSGSFSGSKNKMSKRGSAYVRAALHMAAVTSVIPQKKRPAANPVLLAYYEKKGKSKPGKVAMCAVMHKLCNIIFAVLRDQQPFELRQPEQHAQRLGLTSAA